MFGVYSGHFPIARYVCSGRDTYFPLVVSISDGVGFKQGIQSCYDEFQEFYNIDESVYSDMQNIWDAYRRKSKMNLIVSGSIYSLMQKIFQSKKEPLFGRADNIIKLSAFDLSTLKDIMRDYRSGYTNDDLLALYSFTGGFLNMWNCFVTIRC